MSFVFIFSPTKIRRLHSFLIIMRYEKPVIEKYNLQNWRLSFWFEFEFFLKETTTKQFHFDFTGGST